MKLKYFSAFERSAQLLSSYNDVHFNSKSGVEGKYCLHFHKIHDCPTCLFKNNAIEGSHQRGIIIHGTHSSTVEENVLYNVRGAGIYVEDGNEMYNEIKYNAVICPFPFSDDTLHGCTVPGTSGRIADTSDNQSGIFIRAATNSLVGNRVSNSFNGMLLKAGSIGRGASYDKVCESAAKLARYEGNTFHGNGRFGTYTLGKPATLIFAINLHSSSLLKSSWCVISSKDSTMRNLQTSPS